MNRFHGNQTKSFVLAAWLEEKSCCERERIFITEEQAGTVSSEQPDISVTSFIFFQPVQAPPRFLSAIVCLQSDNISRWWQTNIIITCFKDPDHIGCVSVEDGWGISPSQLLTQPLFLSLVTRTHWRRVMPVSACGFIVCWGHLDNFIKSLNDKCEHSVKLFWKRKRGRKVSVN